MSGKGSNKVLEQHQGLGYNLRNLPSVTDNEDDEEQELVLVKMMHGLDINNEVCSTKEFDDYIQDIGMQYCPMTQCR